MKYVNLTTYPFAVLPGKIRPPEWSATFIVKGSFALHPDGPATPLLEPLPFMGDVVRDEELPNECLYENDFALWKPNADVLLVGTCHAPGGKPTTACRVEFGVGRWSKALAVIGNRHWKKSLLLSSASDPEPFTTLPVSYGNAFGGDGFDKNPAGRGYEKAYLPNIEPIEDRITGPGERPDPSGFGPLNRVWAQRTSKLGSYRGKWLKERWPNFPDDFDFTYFNAAPEDQQFRKYLRGDEDLRFENLHGKQASYRSSLPALRVRCFLSETTKAGKKFREVPMNLDTLFVDLERELLILIWRGTTPVRDEELTDVEHVLAVSEPLKEAAAPAAAYEPLLPKPPPPPAPVVPSAPKPPSALELDLRAAVEQVKKARDAHLESSKKLASQMGFDLSAAMAKPPAGISDLQASLAGAKASFTNMGAQLPPAVDAALAALGPGGKLAAAVQRLNALGKRVPQAPATAEQVKELAAVPGGLKGKDLTGVQLAGIDLSGMDLSGSILKNANLSKAKLVKSNFTGAQLSGANLAGADLSGAVLLKADLTTVHLQEAKLGEADLSRADLSETTAPRAVFSGCKGSKTRWAGANLEGAQFGKAQLEGADFSHSVLKGAKFTGANLKHASLSGAKASGADFSEADLARCALGDQADFRAALFVGSTGPQSIWENSVLDGADFTGAQLVRGNFGAASLRGAKLVGVDAKHASFQKAILSLAQAQGADFFEAIFEKADLSGTDFTGSNLFGAEFLNAVLDGMKTRGANLGKTKLA